MTQKKKAAKTKMERQNERRYERIECKGMSS